jgi:hypothetical protein
VPESTPGAMAACPDLLIAAAVHAGIHADEFCASHERADTAVDSALPGWVGRSAAALSARSGTWATATATLSAAICAHSEVLRVAALQLAEMDHRNGAALTPLPGGTRSP